MLTKGDDYPIHQRPIPVLYTDTDRNFYDRYWFNGYSIKNDQYFSMGLAEYPNVDIMDASFCVIKDGIQHNLRASRHMGMERLDTKVGPIAVEVLEPLKSLRVVIDENEHGISADLIFTYRAIALEEPRNTYYIGSRMFNDYTRLTQNGTWQGWINVKGDRIEVAPDSWFGTRDRSWGIRPVGARDTQPSVYNREPQFYWLWAPINFDDCVVLAHINTDAEGVAWNKNGIIVPLGDEGVPEEMEKVSIDIDFKPGTRHAKSATINMITKDEKDIRIEVEPRFQIYMSGIGYGHPEWGHGYNKGKLAVGYDTIDLSNVNETSFLYIHIQAVSRFTMGDKIGWGVMEQFILGRHLPSGFKDFADCMDPQEMEFFKLLT